MDEKNTDNEPYYRGWRIELTIEKPGAGVSVYALLHRPDWPTVLVGRAAQSGQVTDALVEVVLAEARRRIDEIEARREANW